MTRRYLILLLSVLTTLGVSASTYTIDDVPNVHLLDRHRYVSDPDNLLGNETRKAVDRRLDVLNDSTTAEVSYVIVESIGSSDINRFAQDLARKWGLGKKDKDNGLLVLIVMDQHKIRIHTGSGMEAVIPDIVAGHIMDEDMIPYMREGNLDDAIDASSKRIYNILTGHENADQIRSELAHDEDREIDRTIYTMLLIVAFCSMIFALGIVINKMLKCRKLTNYERIAVMNQGLWILVILTLTSMLMALPFLLIVLGLRSYYRRAPIYCDKCGTKMHRLDEEEDNKYLNPQQNLEEELNSVDYDVWLCDKCGTTEIFPFNNKNSEYEVCPRCHTRAAKMVKDTITLRPTTQHGGEGIKHYHCAYCNHNYQRKYKIAKLESGAAVAGAVAAGSVLGSRGGGGGGFSGGSWGGGGFSGGGASRGW